MMKKIILRRLIQHILYWILAILLCSCEKNNDPSYENQLNFSFTSTGSKQKAFIENYLNDSVTIKINNYFPENPKLKVLFNVTKGGGSVDQEEVIVSNTGVAKTRWKMGNYSCNQILKASIYESSGHYINSFDFYGTGFSYGKWDTTSLLPDIQINDMITDTVNQVTLMTTPWRLYKQGTNYFDWIEIANDVVPNPFSIEMDKNGIIYVSTWRGELYKSLDHGNTWIKCNKPFPSNIYWVEIIVTSDGKVWATNYDNALCFSADGGFTWTETNLMVVAKYIYVLTDGSYLMLTSGCDLLRSEDGGLNWTDLNVADLPLALWVNDNNEAFIFTQGLARTIEKSTDRGDHFTEILTVNPKWGTTATGHFVHKKGNTYYFLIQGSGIVKTKDFLDFSYYRNDYNIVDMFFDRKGTIITTTWEHDKAYYYAKSPTK